MTHPPLRRGVCNALRRLVSARQAYVRIRSQASSSPSLPSTKDVKRGKANW